MSNADSGGVVHRRLVPGVRPRREGLRRPLPRYRPLAGACRDRSRLGVIIEYCAGWLRPQENHVLGLPKQIVQELPSALQELLGYNVVGLLGNVDGRRPLKSLTDNRAVSDGVIDPAKHPQS